MGWVSRIAGGGSRGKEVRRQMDKNSNSEVTVWAFDFVSQSTLLTSFPLQQRKSRETLNLSGNRIGKVET